MKPFGDLPSLCVYSMQIVLKPAVQQQEYITTQECATLDLSAHELFGGENSHYVIKVKPSRPLYEVLNARFVL